MSFASVTLVVCADLFNKRSAFWFNMRDVAEQSEPADGTALKRTNKDGGRAEQGAEVHAVSVFTNITLHQFSLIQIHCYKSIELA